MPFANLAPPPAQDSLIELDESPGRKDPFYAAKTWLIWFQQILITRLQNAVIVTQHVYVPNAVLTGTAAIPTASLLTTTTSGFYRVSYAFHVTQPATTSSSLQLTIGWVQSGTAMTKVFAADTSNLPTTFQGADFAVRADVLTDITYSMAYASVGATPMKFELDVSAEQVA